MTTYVGEGLTIVCAAKDPLTGAVISEADAALTFYAPPKNPPKNADDRTPDQGPMSMSFDATVTNSDGTKGAYIAYVDTTGWAPGRWFYRVTLTGAFASWEYGNVRLSA